MAFDGIDYQGAAFTMPSRHNPKAGLSGPAVSTPLRNSYYQARQHSRLLLCQTYASNGVTPGSTISTGGFTSSATWVRMAEVSVYVPLAVTDLHSHFAFGAYVLGDGTAYTRLVITNGSGTTTGTTVETRVPHNVPLSSFPVVAINGVDPRIELNAYEAQCVAKPAAFHLDAVCTVYLESYVTAGGSGMAQKPFNVSVWWEVEG